MNAETTEPQTATTAEDWARMAAREPRAERQSVSQWARNVQLIARFIFILCVGALLFGIAFEVMDWPGAMVAFCGSGSLLLLGLFVTVIAQLMHIRAALERDR